MRIEIVGFKGVVKCPWEGIVELRPQAHGTFWLRIYVYILGGLPSHHRLSQNVLMFMLLLLPNLSGPYTLRRKFSCQLLSNKYL